MLKWSWDFISILTGRFSSRRQTESDTYFVSMLVEGNGSDFLAKCGLHLFILLFFPHRVQNKQLTFFFKLFVLQLKHYRDEKKEQTVKLLYLKMKIKCVNGFLWSLLYIIPLLAFHQYI